MQSNVSVTSSVFVLKFAEEFKLPTVWHDSFSLIQQKGSDKLVGLVQTASRNIPEEGTRWCTGNTGIYLGGVRFRSWFGHLLYW